MINKTIMITSIAVLIAVTSVATTMTMVQASPIGDVIEITIETAPDLPPPVPPFVSATVVVEDSSLSPVEYEGFVFTPDPNELTVDVDDGMIWIILTPDPFFPPSPINPFSVHIEDIDWLDENGLPIDGEIGDVQCELNPFADVIPMVNDEGDTIWIDIIPFPFFNEPIEVHCEFDVIHVEPEAVFLVIDEDSIDNGIEPNDFSGDDVGEDDAEVGVRTQLPFFADNVGEMITLHTGEVGDEGWFALKSIPESWDDAGPNDGLRNYLNAEPGLGTESDELGPEDLLDKIPDVTPLRFTGLKLLEGERVCAVVYDSDISINYDPLDGSLKGANLGTVAFEVISVTAVAGEDDFSDKSLPKVDIEILDVEQLCNGSFELLTDAPEPESSSEPEDVGP